GTGEGNALILVGTSDPDTLTLSPTVAVFHAAQVIAFVHAEAVGAYGEAADAAYLFDGPGDDSLSGTPAQTMLSGSGGSSAAIGFGSVSAFASGGNDNAYLFSSPRPAPFVETLFVATPTYAYLQAGASLNVVSNFKTVRGFASLALLFDSPGNDVFVDLDVAYLAGDGFLNVARAFEVQGRSGAGGTDVALLFDLAFGNDHLQATPSFSHLVGFSGGGNVDALVIGFAQVFVRSNGIVPFGSTFIGFDSADLDDSPGNDTFSGQGSYGTLTGPGGSVTIIAFSAVRAKSSSGGFD